uniref:Beta-catenin-like protein 1 n=1 Tax=Mandrillus leucophaeus TaxID=9568 RepID=A0A2K5XSZ9_MANLE
DTGKLPSYQPNRGIKCPRDDKEEEQKMHRKQISTQDWEEEMIMVEEAEDDKKWLLQIIDTEGEEEEKEEELLDESSIKFPDNPEKFMESQLDLHDIIQKMHVVATMPDLYHLLLELNAVQSLLGLLGHNNTDVSIAGVDLNIFYDSEEGAEVLIDALVTALLVQNVERLDESVKEEANSVHNTLVIVGNMLEMCTRGAQQGLPQWLLMRLKAKKPFDANKLYCSEMQLDGIDALLQQLSVFKRHNPSTAKEQEMMENPSNREHFLKGEGLQLMNLMPREKKISRSRVLKVLIVSKGVYNCGKFVDILVGTTDREHKEHVCSILAFLLWNLRGHQRTWLLNKFTENDSELMELHFQYLGAMQVADKRKEGEKHDMVQCGEIIDSDMGDEFYLQCLDAGLFVLQCICCIMAKICNANVPQICPRVHQILNMRIIKGYAEFWEKEQKHILGLLENF